MMRSHNSNSQRNLNNSNIHGIVTPDGAENAPVILVITSSSLINSTINAYLHDHGYRIAGPYDSHNDAAAFIRRYTPDLLIFDAINNSAEIPLIQETINMEIKSTPIIILGNDNTVVKADILAYLKLPLNHQDLGYKIRELIPFIDVSPTEELIKFVNKLFLKLIQLGPEEHRRSIEEKINLTIYEFSSRNYDFTKQSGESPTILFTTQNRVNLKDVISQLKFYIDFMIEEIDKCCSSTWGASLVKDAVESLLINMSPLPTSVLSFAEALGINTREFQQSLSRMVPKLSDDEKALFVAVFTQDDYGPNLLMHITNDEEIAKGLGHDIAAQVLTVVGQGTSYHEGIFGPIPIPTANNICALIWSRLLTSEIKDERMQGQSLTVVAVGFYNSLITHLPPTEKMKRIFDVLETVNNINDISDMHLEMIKDHLLNNLV